MCLIVLVLQSTADSSNRYIIIVNKLAKVFCFWQEDVTVEFLAIPDWEKYRVESTDCSKIVGRD